MPLRKGSNHPFWKGDSASSRAKHRRAERLFKLGPCQRCGKNGTDRHHVDDDPGNNHPSNVMILCSRCHKVIDGRLERFVKMAKDGEKKRKPPRQCLNCKQLKKHYANGLCGLCYAYFRNHGTHRPFLSLAEKMAKSRAAPCLRCGRPAGILGRSVKGFCLTCYYYAKSGGTKPKRKSSNSQRMKR